MMKIGLKDVILSVCVILSAYVILSGSEGSYIKILHFRSE